MTATGFLHKLFLMPAEVVFAARVNQAEAATFYNQAQVFYDTVTVGSYTDIQHEMLITLGSAAGLDDYGRGWIRSNATANTIYFGWASRTWGEGELAIYDNLYITVYNLYIPRSKTPRILDSGVQYVDYAEDFAAFGALPPVIDLGCGAGRHADLNVATGEATFAFDATASYIVAPGASSLVYAYTLPAEATVVAGATNTAVVTFTVPEGAYYVTLNAVDDLGTPAEPRKVLCVAGEPTGTFICTGDIQLTQTWETSRVSLQISDPLPLTAYLNNTVGILWQTQYEDGVEVTPSGTTGQENMVFTGWVGNWNARNDFTARGFLSDTNLELIGIGGWLQAKMAFQVTIKRDSNPVAWDEMAGFTPNRFYVHMLARYTNALALADFEKAGTLGNLPYPGFVAEGQSFYDVINARSISIAHRFTSDSLGRLRIVPFPQWLDWDGGGGGPFATVISRTNAVQAAITLDKWSSIEYGYRTQQPLAWLWGEGVQATATDLDALTSPVALFCVAPGRAPAQGEGQETLAQMLVVSQLQLNGITGHYFRWRNNPRNSITLTLAVPDRLGIEPARGEWITFTNTAASAGERGLVSDGERLLPLEVTTTITPGGLQNVVIQCEAETVGTPAETILKPGNPYLTPYLTLPTPTFPEPDGPDIYDMGRQISDIILVHADGYLSLTNDFSTSGLSGGPDYVPANLSLGEAVLDARADPWSPIYSESGDTVNGLLATPSRIVGITDARDISSRSVDVEHTFAAATNDRALDWGRAYDRPKVASYYDDAGVKVTSWSGAAWAEVLVAAGLAGAGIGSILSGEWAGYDWAHVWDISETDPATLGIVGGYGEWRAAEAYESGGTGWYTKFYSGPPVRRVLNFGANAESTVTSTIKKVIARGRASTYPVLLGHQSGVKVPNPIGAHYLPSVDASNFQALWRDTGGVLTWEGSYSADFISGELGWEMWIDFLPDGADDVNHDMVNYIAIAGDGPDPFSSAPIPSSITLTTKPTIAASSHISQQAYAGAFVSEVGTNHVTEDEGATWSAGATVVLNSGDYLGGCYYVPYHNNPNDLIAYFGKQTSSAYHLMRRSADGAVEDISPTIDGVTYGPADPQCIHSCPTNRFRMAFCLTRADTQEVAIWTTVDGGTTLVQRTQPVARSGAYTGVWVTADPDYMIFYGPAIVGVSGNGGATIDNRAGNAHASEVVAVWGG